MASRGGRRSICRMDAVPVLTLDQLTDAMRSAAPCDDDAAIVTCDGRRLGSREAVLAFLAELDAERRSDAAAG